MKCKKASKFLALFVGGDLPTENVRVLEEHLENCPNCARELESLCRTQEVLKMLASDSQPTLGANYWLEILQRIETLDEREEWARGQEGKNGEYCQRKIRSVISSPVVVLCSACLVFILAVLIFFSRLQEHNLPPFSSPQSKNFRSFADFGSFRELGVEQRALPRKVLTRRKEARIPISSIVPAPITVSLPTNPPHPLSPSCGEGPGVRLGGEVETKYPLVEDVSKLNGTVMVFKTENPKIDIVWIFGEEENL